MKWVAAMADSWVDWMVDLMVDYWAVELGYTAVGQLAEWMVVQRVAQWVDLMDVSMVAS